VAANALRLQVLLDAVDRATGPFKRVMAGSKGLAGAIRQSNAALKELKAQQTRLQGFRDLKNRVDGSSTAMRAAQQRVQALKAEMAGVENPTRRASAALNQAERAAAKLKATHLGNLRALRDSRQAMTAAGIGARDLGASERRLKADIAATSAAMRQQQARLSAIEAARKRASRIHSAGMSATAHGAGMLYGGQRVLRGAAAPASAAMQFESAMADVRKVVDFDTPEAFGQMAKDVQDLSQRLPMTSTEISQLVAAAGQANIPRQELLRFAEDAAKMGVAFDTTAEDAGQTMATWRTAFRMGQDDVNILADRINYLGNTGPANVRQISEVVNRIGALGEVAGLQSGPLAALGATVAGMGIQSEVSATGIKNMLLTLSSGAGATKKQQDAMQALGLDAMEMAQAMQRDAGGAILVVLERLRELPKAQQAATMTRMFGRESIGAIAPLLTNLELLKTNFGKVADAQKYAGSMEAEYAARVGTSENALQLAKNAATVLAETIGATLLPDIKVLSEQVGRALSQFTAWTRENPKLAKALIVGALAMATLITVLGGLLILVGTAAMGFAQLHKGILLLSGGRSLGLLAGKALPMVGRALMILGRAMMANPVLLAIGLIATAAYLIYQHWDAIGPLLKAVWDKICGWLGAAWDGIKRNAGVLLEWLKTVFSYTPLGLIVANWDAIRGYLASLWDSIKQHVTGAWNVITGIFSGDGDKVRAGLLLMWTTINEILGGWPAKFMQFGVHLIQGLINGIGSMAGAVRDAVVGTVTGAVDKFKSFLGIRSPSRLFAQFGDYTMQGFAGGLNRSQQLPLQSVLGLGDRMHQIGAGVALGAAVTPAVAVDTRPPLTASGAGTASHSATYNITIHAAPGVDGPSIAHQVRAEIERIEREKSARARSRLSD
jgi:TP901 family phage tail tape measure protein